MLKRLCWVLMTLITRPAAWLMLMGVAAFSIMPLGGSRQVLKLDLIRPVVAPAFDSIDSVQALNAADPKSPQNVRFGMLALGRASGMSAGSMTENEANLLDRLITFEQIEAFAFESRISTPTTLDRVAQLDTLRALQLGQIPEEWRDGHEVNLIEDLTPLLKLKNLEVLDLADAIGADTSLALLAALPNLQSLAISNPDVVNDERIAEIAAVQGLKTLYLPNVHGRADAMASIKLLQRSTSLQTVYLPVGGDGVEVLREVRDDLVGVRVRRGDFAAGTSMLLMGPLAGAGMLGLFGAHIAAWFSGAGSCLLPNHRGAHRLAVWLVFGLGCVMLAGTLIWATGTMWAPLGLVITVNAALMRSHLWSGVQRARWRQGVDSILVFVYMVLIVTAVKPDAAPWIQAFVYGDYPLVSAGLFLFAAVLVLDADQRLVVMCRDRVAQNLPVIMTMDDYKQDALAKRLLNTSAVPTGWWPGKPKQQRPWGWWLVAIVLFGMIAWPMFRPWMANRFGAVSLPSSYGLPYLLFMFFIMPVWVFGVRWWQQFPMLVGMMIRPPKRREHITRFFGVVARDFAKLLPIAVLAAGAMVSNHGGFTEAWWLTGAGVLALALGIVALAYSATLVLAPIRGVRAAWLIAAVVFSGLYGLVMTLSNLDLDPSGSWAVMLFTGLIMLVVAAAIQTLAWRQYGQIEWGKY